MDAKAVKVLWDKYRTFTFEQRLFDSAHLLPPPLPGKCWGCWRELPLFQLGWSEIEFAAKANRDLPETMDRWCDKCANEEEEEEEATP